MPILVMVQVTEDDSADRWGRRVAVPASVAFISISCTDFCGGRPEQASPIPAPASTLVQLMQLRVGF